jgi:hypothetical protein
VLKNVSQGFLDMLGPVKELTPGGATYVNEASYLEPEWQAAYWGENYNKLLEIKQRHDPSHVFDCWKCVGWRGEDE